MRWPPDHPARVDEALAPWAAGADELCPGGEVVRVLRHLPGRRVTSLVRTGGEQAVLKVFASPRGRGNIRRLRAFAATDAAPLVPRPFGADASGHVALLEHVEGTPLLELGIADVAEAVGRALRRLHDSGAELDREWTVDDELAQLVKTAGPRTRALVERATARARPVAEPVVPSHRDLHPAQVVVSDGDVRFIDLDDAALAPAALDVGNLLGHLDKEVATGALAGDAAQAAEAAVLHGYGGAPPGLDAWRHLTVVRLAALAETRHRRPDETRALTALAGA